MLCSICRILNMAVVFLFCFVRYSCSFVVTLKIVSQSFQLIKILFITFLIKIFLQEYLNFGLIVLYFSCLFSHFLCARLLCGSQVDKLGFIRSFTI